MIKHILVAVSAHNDDAVLKTAIDKARQTGARLTAAYVVDETPWWAMTGVEYGCLDSLSVVEDIERAVERRCNDTFECEAWDIDARAITVHMQGSSVAGEIAKLALHLDADLIVVGAGRRSAWKFWEERMSDVIGRNTRRTVLVATGVPSTCNDHDCSAVLAQARKVLATHAHTHAA
jgi:nucleotide-binding universal stress UspA family protein